MLRHLLNKSSLEQNQIAPTVQDIRTVLDTQDFQDSPELLAALVAHSVALGTAPSTPTPQDTLTTIAIAQPDLTAQSAIQTPASPLVSTSDFAPTLDPFHATVEVIEVNLEVDLVVIPQVQGQILIQSAP